MVSCVKSVLSFMMTALAQNLLHKEHGLIRGLYLKKIQVKNCVDMGNQSLIKKAILAKANLTTEESIASKNNEERAHANELYTGKLVQIVHFFSSNNLVVKCLYPKFVEFLSSELQEPIIKQYLDTCAKNATYISHETCDSLIHSLDNYFLTKSNECINKCNDIVIYADESTSVARKEMLGIFLATFDEMDKKFKIEYVSLIEVSSTESKIVVHAIEKTLIKRDIDISKTRFCCLDGTNLMSGKYKCLENI